MSHALDKCKEFAQNCLLRKGFQGLIRILCYMGILLLSATPMTAAYLKAPDLIGIIAFIILLVITTEDSPISSPKKIISSSCIVIGYILLIISGQRIENIYSFFGFVILTLPVFCLNWLAEIPSASIKQSKSNFPYITLYIASFTIIIIWIFYPALIIHFDKSYDFKDIHSGLGSLFVGGALITSLVGLALQSNYQEKSEAYQKQKNEQFELKRVDDLYDRYFKMISEFIEKRREAASKAKKEIVYFIESSEALWESREWVNEPEKDFSEMYDLKVNLQTSYPIFASFDSFVSAVRDINISKDKELKTFNNFIKNLDPDARFICVFFILQNRNHKFWKEYNFSQISYFSDLLFPEYEPNSETIVLLLRMLDVAYDEAPYQALLDDITELKTRYMQEQKDKETRIREAILASGRYYLHTFERN